MSVKNKVIQIRITEAELQETQVVVDGLQGESNELAEVSVSSFMRYATREFVKDHKRKKTHEVLRFEILKSDITMDGLKKVYESLDEITKDYEDETGATSIASSLQTELLEQMIKLKKGGK